MSSYLEFEGKTTDEAIQKACKELGLAEDQLEVDVISFGSSGIFGLVGVKKAKIRVKVKDSLPQEDRTPSTGLETTEGAARFAKEVLEKIVSHVVDNFDILVEENRDDVLLNIKGEKSAILIGKHGQTLDALQYIVQKIINRKSEKKLRITVDIEGYREKRKASLTHLAIRLGEKVKRTGKPVTISPMNAHDRRIIHIALKNDNMLRTRSGGNGSLKKLIIYPNKR